MILNGENVTSLLRTEETGKMASKTSKYATVRTKLVALQRGLAKKTDVIMDGRDIGQQYSRMHLQRYILLQVLMRELREDMMNLRKKR